MFKGACRNCEINRRLRVLARNKRIDESPAKAVPAADAVDDVEFLESGEFSGDSWGDARAHSDPRG